MNLLDKIGSDEMQTVRDNTVDRIAELMYMGEIPMPRSTSDYGELINVEVKRVKNEVIDGIQFHAMIPAGQNMYSVYSHIVSKTEADAMNSYAECVAFGINKVAEDAEEIIDLAVAEAHTKFRDRLVVPPLFLLITTKKTVKSLYKWLTDNTVITEGVIAGIISITEMMQEEDEMCFLRVTESKVIPLSNAEFSASRGPVFDFTAILNFASSFLRENIPNQYSVIRYHTHKRLIERYDRNDNGKS